MAFLPLPKLRGQVVAVSQRLHHNGWVANHDGNVSVRLTGQRYLITCSAISKRDVDDASLLLVDGEGRVLEGRRKPFSELDLHLVLYRSRPDVHAVLHAHPPYATAWGLTGKDLAPIAMPEIVVSLGDRIPTLPRTMPRDPSGTATLGAEASRCDAMLVAGNGVFACGADLTQALLRMELVEHYAKILHLASGRGPVVGLSDSEIQTLLASRAKPTAGPKG